MKTRRQLPRTPSIDAPDIVSGVPNVTVEMGESSRIAMRKKSSRGDDNCRHSWTPTQSPTVSRAERRQLSITDDQCAPSSCCKYSEHIYCSLIGLIALFPLPLLLPVPYPLKDLPILLPPCEAIRVMRYKVKRN